MAKHKSRATRAGEAASDIRSIADELQELADQYNDIDTLVDEEIGKDEKDELKEEKKNEICEDLVAKANAAIGNIDTGEFDSLKDEMQSWRDNMDSANMTHLPKYDEVNDACDELDNADFEVSEVTSADEIESVAEQLNEACDTLENVMFPGMY